MLTNTKKGETAVHCCDPALSVLVTLVSRNVFHIVSALQSIVFIHFFKLIWSLVDPTLTAFIVCGPLYLSLITLNHRNKWAWFFHYLEWITITTRYVKGLTVNVITSLLRTRLWSQLQSYPGVHRGQMSEHAREIARGFEKPCMWLWRRLRLLVS